MEDLREVRRADGELCGFIVGSGILFQPLTVFKVSLGDPREESTAIDFLIGSGLQLLQQPWLALISGEWVDVLILAASPVEVIVTTDVFGGGGQFGTTHTFPAGTDQLRPKPA